MIHILANSTNNQCIEHDFVDTIQVGQCQDAEPEGTSEPEPETVGDGKRHYSRQ